MDHRTYKLIALVILLVVAGSVHAGGDPDTLSEFMRAVRLQLNITNNAQLADSILQSFCERSIAWTSTDIGGVEYMYKFDTDTSVAFYTLPDSITEILYATVISGTRTKSLKAFYPQFFGDFYDVTHFEGYSEDNMPLGYNVWNDTIQLYPIPNDVDSIYLKCYIEHPELNATTDTVRLAPPFVEAALLYACSLVEHRRKDYAAAKFYLEAYGILRGSLLAKYAKKWDILKP